MLTFKTVRLPLGFAALFVFSLSNAQVLTNGGFEDGLTGWTVDYSNEGHVGVAPGVFTTPYEGSSYAYGWEQMPWLGLASLSQSFAATVGHTYDISFAFRNYDDSEAQWPNSFGVSVGDLQFSTTPPHATWPYWMTYYGSFTATHASETLRFAFATSTLSGVLLIDDAIITERVAAVPEPATYAFMGVGLALVGLASRRKTKLN